MQITAAVCTYNRYDLLRESLASLRAQSLPAEACQILIVDNSPNAARARDFAAGYRGVPNLRFLYVDEPGCSHARNVAIREATAPIVAFIDDDAVARIDWLANVVGVFATADAKVAAVGGPVAPLWEVPRPRWLHDKLLPYYSILDLGGQPRDIRLPDSLIGTNVAYRRWALEAIGGFRTDLGLCGKVQLRNEELDVQQRLQQAGHRIVYSPEISVEHRVPKERLTRGWLRQRIFWQGVSDLIAAGGQGPAVASPSGKFLFGETNCPRRFNRQCRRIVDAIEQFSAGHRVL